MEKKANKDKKSRKRTRIEESKKEDQAEILKPEESVIANQKEDLNQQKKILKPKSAYILFFNDFNHSNSHLKLSDRVKAAGVKWSKMTDIEKKGYRDLANFDKQRYLREIGRDIQPKDTRISAFEMSKLKKRREKD